MTLQVSSADEAQRIHEATLDVLEGIGAGNRGRRGDHWPMRVGGTPPRATLKTSPVVSL